MEKDEFRLLCAEELAGMYESDMRRDFPPAELKPLKSLLRLLEEGRYEPYGLFRAGRMISYAFYWNAGGPYVMLDYFAVRPEVRSRGIGGALLRDMLDRFCVDGRGIFGEVEIPNSGDEAVDSLRRRRLHFYLRAGMRQAGFRTRIFGVPYLVLSYGPQLADAQLMEACRKIYRTAVPEPAYRKQILIPWDEEVDG